MIAPAIPTTSTPVRATLLTRRKRIVLRHLLNGEVRRCSVSALQAMQRRGWIHGPENAYQLTDTGRQLAELSESAGPGDLEIDLSAELSIANR